MKKITKTRCSRIIHYLKINVLDSSLFAGFWNEKFRTKMQGFQPHGNSAKFPIIILIAMLAFFPLASATTGIMINEVMYNPIGDDNNQEFVEIFGTDNLSGYVIGDLFSNDTLVMLRFVSGNFSLITEDGFNYSELNCSVFSAGATIGNNLNNDQDTIFLYFNNTLIDSMSYNGSLANNNNLSLELSDGVWKESCELHGSPGRENCAQTIIMNETNQTEANNTHINQTAINNTEINQTEINQTEINQTETNFTETNQTANETANETANSTANQTSNSSSPACSVSINISTDKDIYNDGEQIKIKNSLSGNNYPFIIMYWVEDLFGNITKAEYNTSNINTKYYTPHIDEKDSVLLVKNKLIYLGCNNTNSSLESKKLIIVKNEVYAKSDDNISEEGDETNPESSIAISTVYSSNSLSFGDNVKVKLDIWKGETTKSVVYAYAEDSNGKKVSEKTTFYLDRKNSAYNISVLVFLDDDCKHDSGYYTLVVEGLDDIAEQEISIKSIECEEGSQEKTSEKKTGEFTSVATAAKKESLPKILSFYTRTKKYNPKENVTLFASISECEGCKLWLIAEQGEQEVMLNGSKASFNVAAKPGSNSFLLELRQAGKAVSSESLLFNLSYEEKKAEQGLAYSQGIEKVEGNLNVQPSANMEKATGSVVYESSSSKMAGLAPYIIIFLLLLLTAGFILKNRR